MNDEEQRKASGNGDEPATGPNLTLLYSLIALALAAAIGLAALIVRPFYLRR
jgi:hypothetical protein